ncbi:hypothetical protein ABZX65_27070 [Streptomyces sp. NPDC003300]|uniref:hypothetical protein n=1 Tax=unclassified Streptomyces TaxID=2593676 RepID=UPI0033A7D87E
MNKDIQTLLRRVRRQGFQVRMGGAGHYRITRDGRTITIPATPTRSHRSIANARAALRRIGAQL